MKALSVKQPSDKAIRVLPPSKKEDSQCVDHNELRPFLEDLMRRYDKLASELQAAQLKNHEQSKQNQQLRKENSDQTQVLKVKDEEISYLYSKLTAYQNKHEKQLDLLSNDNVKVVEMLTEKIEQLNSLLTEKQCDLEQTKSLLILREQEVLEWRSRKAFEESRIQKELNLVKQSLLVKEQELTALRIKYDFKQKTHSTTEQQQELNNLKQELYIKELSANNTNQCSEHCEILKNEVDRVNDLVVELRSEIETMRSQLVDYEWLKEKYNSQKAELYDRNTAYVRM